MNLTCLYYLHVLTESYYLLSFIMTKRTSLPDELEVYTKKLVAKNKKSNNTRGKVRLSTTYLRIGFELGV